MNSGVSKSWTRRSRLKPSKALEERLWDAVASKGAGLPQSPREQSPVNGDIAKDKHLHAKRRLHATSETDHLFAKRARLIRAEAQLSRVEDEDPKQAAKTTLQQPKPKPPRRPHASFLKDFVDPVHPNRPDSAHAFVSEWLESVESDREKCCRSDSHLHRSDNETVPRQHTGSAPEMGNIRDVDGFVVPSTPASTGSRSYRIDADTGSVAPSDFTCSGQSSARTLVEDPNYRVLNLAANNIYMRNPDEEFPEHVAHLVHHVGKDRDSPGPSPDQLRHNADLYGLEDGAGEPEVEDYFRGDIFPKSEASGTLKRSDRQIMAKHNVPSTRSKLKVSTPVPDMLYGYRHEALPLQQAQLISMGTQPMANTDRLIYPFLVIEFKGDGGSLWVATNQCLGGSTSCVNIAERLNRQLQQRKSDEVRPIDSAVFSVAMSGTEARLYISWKHNELDFYMRKIKSFCLQEPEQYLEFRKYVRNIIDWGKDRRLNEIRDSLDSLLEESRKRTAEAAKSRQPPSDGSATSSGKKHKSSSSPRNSSRTNSAEGPSGEGDKPYWDLDKATG